MIGHRYKLPNDIIKVDCPDCKHKRTFRQYIDTTNNQLLHPIVPHITAEIAERYNYKLVWPEPDMQFLVDDHATIVIQVNGKIRGTIDVSKGILQEEIQKIALELLPVNNAIGSNPVKKIIYVKDKILNFIC